MRLFRLALLAALSITATARAASNLQITEMWAGGVDGTEATSDWFELTNFGDMAATGLNGTLFYDDDSQDPEKNDPLVNIDTIAPGESVIYLTSWEDNYLTPGDAVAAFEAMWGSPAGDLTGVQIGWVVGGSGLSGGGDATAIFSGNTAGSPVVDVEFYQPPAGTNANAASFIPDPIGSFVSFPSLQSVAGVMGAYEGNLPAGDGILLDDNDIIIGMVDVPNAVGSPGFATAPVPEPSTIFMITLSMAGVAATARRR